MPADLFIALAVFAFVSSITPGPNNLMLMASGANFGVSRTIPHMLGVSIGFTLMTVLVGLGLMRVFDLFPISYVILKIFSVGYLLYLAWKIAHAAPPSTDGSASSEAKPFTFFQAALFQWVNPKAWAMALTAVSAYSLAAQPVVSVLIVAIVFGVINLPSVSLWTVAGAQMRRFLSDPLKLRIFNISAALLLAASALPILTNSATASGR
ncbi:LysE family translocator [Hyphococcus sp.]|uniref:LysE family translocator n=1 Tax=Hyphococcus sp. TaxID=2038636 RepID=UPI00208BDEBE|nr:MAG: lysine transporter LysE [Marinicaulis sp.]